MSILHERGSSAPVTAAAHHVLLRRMMIRCPATGLASDTGFELSALPDVSTEQHVLIDCLACGQDHAWWFEDVFFQ